MTLVAAFHKDGYRDGRYSSDLGPKDYARHAPRVLARRVRKATERVASQTEAWQAAKEAGDVGLFRAYLDGLEEGVIDRVKQFHEDEEE